MRNEILIGFALGLVALPSQAQISECEDSLVVIQCFQNQFEEARTQAAKDEMAESVQRRPAPATDNASAGSLTDLLSPLLAAFGLGDTNSENGNITLQKTFLFGEDSSWKGSLGATLLADPELYAPLKMKLESDLPEDGRDDRINEVEGEIERYQNIDAIFALTYEGRGMGRRWGRRPEQYDLLAASAFASAVEENVSNKALREFTVSLTDHQQALQLLNEPVKNCKDLLDGADGADGADAPSKEDAQLLAEKFDAVIARERGNVSRLDPATQKKLKLVADLVDNQPQFVLKAKYKDRDGVAGPDSLEGSLSLEFGLSGNVNDLDSWARTSGAVECQKKATIGTNATWSWPCMERYKQDEKKRPEKGQRFSLEVTYSDIDAFTFSSTADNFEFSTEASEKLIASLGYGRWLSGFDLGGGAQLDNKARFDLEASYEDVSDDELRQNRFVATATLSQKMTSCVSLSVGLVYANRPEFLGEVDKELGARVGLRWDNKQLEGCMGNN